MLEKLKSYALRRFRAPKEHAAAKIERDELVKDEKEWFVGFTNMTPEKALRCAWQAAVLTYGRDDLRVYKKGLADPTKYKVRMLARAKAAEIAEQYKGEVSEWQHFHNVKELRKTLKEEFGRHLEGGKFCFGRSQKFLNLYLKNLWCLGEIDNPPPHCTFDGIIIREVLFPLIPDEDAYWRRLKQITSDEMVDNLSTWSWTKSDKPEHYLIWVAAAKEAALRCGCRSLVEWELIAWNKNRRGENPLSCLVSPFQR